MQSLHQWISRVRSWRPWRALRRTPQMRPLALSPDGTLSRPILREVTAHGVRVSCVCPGAVDTAMLRAGAGGDADKASAVIGGGDVLAPEQAAERIMQGVKRDQFLILTHPEMHRFIVGKAEDPERWVRGMSKLWSRAQALLG